MPTNTHSPLPSGDICAPTPSDTVGSIDNILTRLEAVEEELARLKSGDLSVYNLSLLDPAYAAVNNALALSMLPPGVTEQFPGSAWVTAYGTISGVVFPSDFVKNLYGGLDGVLQYPVGSPPSPSLGGVGGALTVYWDTIDAGSIVGQVDFLGEVDPTTTSALSWDSGDPKRLTVETTGLYMFVANMSSNQKATISDASRGFTVEGRSSLDAVTFSFGDQKMQDKTTGTGTTNQGLYSATRVFYCTSGDYIKLTPFLFTPDDCQGTLTGVLLGAATT